jgi:hypothetical protein
MQELSPAHKLPVVIFALTNRKKALAAKLYYNDVITARLKVSDVCWRWVDESEIIRYVAYAYIEFIAIV